MQRKSLFNIDMSQNELVSDVSRQVFNYFSDNPQDDYFDRTFTKEEVETSAVNTMRNFDYDMDRSKQIIINGLPKESYMQGSVYLPLVKNYIDSLPCHPLLKRFIYGNCHQNGLSNSIVGPMQFAFINASLTIQPTIQIEIEAGKDGSSIDIKLTASVRSLILAKIFEDAQDCPLPSADIQLEDDGLCSKSFEEPLFIVTTAYRVTVMAEDKLNVSCLEYKIYRQVMDNAIYEVEMANYAQLIRNVFLHVSRINEYESNLLSIAPPHQLPIMPVALKNQIFSKLLNRDLNETELSVLLRKTKHLAIDTITIINSKLSSINAHVFLHANTNTLSFASARQLKDVKISASDVIEGSKNNLNLIFNQCLTLELHRCSVISVDGGGVRVSIKHDKHIKIEELLAFLALNRFSIRQIIAVEPLSSKSLIQGISSALADYLLSEKELTPSKIDALINFRVSEDQRARCLELMDEVNPNAANAAMIRWKHQRETVTDLNAKIVLDHVPVHTVELNVSETALTKAGSSTLAAFKKLEILHLDGYRDEEANFGEMPSLRQLSMRRSKKLRTVSVSAPNLQHINFNESEHLELDSLISVIATSNVALETMTLSLINCHLHGHFHENGMCFNVTANDLMQHPSLLAHLADQFEITAASDLSGKLKPTRSTLISCLRDETALQGELVTFANNVKLNSLEIREYLDKHIGSRVNEQLARVELAKCIFRDISKCRIKKGLFGLSFNRHTPFMQYLLGYLLENDQEGLQKFTVELIRIYFSIYGHMANENMEARNGFMRPIMLSLLRPVFFSEHHRHRYAVINLLLHLPEDDSQLNSLLINSARALYALHDVMQSKCKSAEAHINAVATLATHLDDIAIANWIILFVLSQVEAKQIPFSKNRSASGEKRATEAMLLALVRAMHQPLVLFQRYATFASKIGKAEWLSPSLHFIITTLSANQEMLQWYHRDLTASRASLQVFVKQRIIPESIVDLLKENDSEQPRMRYQQRLDLFKKLVNSLTANGNSYDNDDDDDIGQDIRQIKSDIEKLDRDCRLHESIVFSRHDRSAVYGSATDTKERQKFLDWRCQLGDVQKRICGVIKKNKGIDISKELEEIFCNKLSERILLEKLFGKNQSTDISLSLPSPKSTFHL